MSTVNEQSYELYVDGALKAEGNAHDLGGFINEAFAYAKEIHMVPVRQPAQHKAVVERYVATVHLVLPDVDSQQEAIDQISNILTHDLESNGGIEGWGYAKFGGQWLYPTKQVVRSPEEAEDSGDILDY